MAEFGMHKDRDLVELYMIHYVTQWFFVDLIFFKNISPLDMQNALATFRHIFGAISQKNHKCLQVR